MSANRILVVVAIVASGCTVGPVYHAPSTRMPGAYDTGPAAPASTQPSATAPARPVDIARWWQSLNDPELDSLVRRAVEANLDLKIALARLQQARAAEYVVSGGALPLVDFAAGAGRGTGSDSTRGRTPGPLHSADNTKGLTEITHVAGFDAAWEIDLFGRFTRQIEAARADTQAAAEARNDVVISLIADVARAYVSERALQLRLAVARQNIQAQQQTVDLVQKRVRQGMNPEYDLVLSQRQLAAAQAALAPLEAGIAQSQRRIAVLLGKLPQEMYSELSHPGNLPAPPPKIGPGLPIELLRRRPDIRQAERELAASTARVGIATANLFPRVALLGAYGMQGQGLGRAPVMNKEIWSFGPTAYWPVLDFGTLDAVVEVQDYRTRELLYSYRRAVLLAVEEVDNAIGNYTAQQDRLEQLNLAVSDAQRTVQLATERYQNGQTSLLDVVDAQRQLYDLQDQYALAQETTDVQYIALYKALGGGWEPFQRVPLIRKPRPAVIAATATAIAPGRNDDH